MEVSVKKTRVNTHLFRFFCLLMYSLCRQQIGARQIFPRILIAWALFIIVVPGSFSAIQAGHPVSAPPRMHEELDTYAAGEVLVLVSADVNRNHVIEKPTETLNGVELSVQGNVIRRISLGRAREVLRVKLPAGKSVKTALAEAWARHDRRIRAVEPNYRLRVLATYPNDPSFTELWSLDNNAQTGGTLDADIDAPEAWDLTTGSSDIVVAVVDSGVDYLHPDLSENMWVNAGEIPDNNIDDDNNGYVDDVHGYDFVQDDGDPIDVYGHGTHCAGTIAARGNNNLGVAGVNWQCKIMACRFLGATGYGYTSEAIKAINYAVANGAKILSNSWGGGAYSASLEAAIENAYDQGVLFVVAAGNAGSNNDNSPYYPASYDAANVIAVAATDHNDELADFSNYGPRTVHLGGPGVDILSTVVSYETIFFEDFQGATLPGLAGTQMTPTGSANRWGTVQRYVDVPNNISAHSDWQNSWPYLGSSDGSIVTPFIDTLGRRGVLLEFMYRYQIGSTDVLEVDVWDGANWQTIFYRNDNTSFNPDFYYWIRIEIPDSYLHEQMQVRFRWVTDETDNVFFGAEIDNIYVRCFSGDYSTAYSLYSGTSMATPHVSGVAALLAGHNPWADVFDLKNRLLWAGDPIAALTGKTVSGRRLNAYNTLALPPELTVIAPNGGQEWPLGLTKTISWISIGGDATVDIYLLKAGVVHTQLADDVENNGSFTWEISPTLPAASDYRIRIDDGISIDDSDADISLLELGTLFSEDFEAGLGGFTINNSFGDGNGLWHLTTGCYAALTGHTAPTVLYYGLDSQCDYHAGKTEGVIDSPVIDLSGATGAIWLKFNYFLETEGFSQKYDYDVVTVEVSQNGGPFNTIAANSNGTLADPSGQWLSGQVDLSSLAGSQIQLRFTFRTFDSYFNAFPGFCIDDVEILTTTGETPPVALNGSAITIADDTLRITLEAIDDGQPSPLTYTITALAGHGKLTDPCTAQEITDPCTILGGNGHEVIYVSDSGYSGPDSFQFQVYDGKSYSNTATFSITVHTLDSLSTIYHNDFETGIGNLTIDNNFGDGNGLWHLTTTCQSTLEDHSVPAACYYGLDSQCDYDAGKTEGVVYSPTISLAGVSAPILLEFNYLLETEQAPGAYDIVELAISENDGPFVMTLSNSNSTLSDPSGGWSTATVDISAMADSDIKVRFGFRTVDRASNDFDGFYIDDIEVRGLCLVPCEPTNPNPYNGQTYISTHTSISWDSCPVRATSTDGIKPEILAALDLAIETSGINDGPITATPANAYSQISREADLDVISIATYTKPEQIASVYQAEELGIQTSSTLNVLVCASDYFPGDVRQKLLSTGRFNSVSIINVGAYTPTLALLQAFDAVLIYSVYDYHDAAALGDVMADYVDSGGGVVCMMFETARDADTQMMQGRWNDEEYFAIPRGGDLMWSPATLGTIHDPNHPIMRGVSVFDGGDLGARPETFDITSGSVRIADWSDGRPLLVTKTINNTPRVDLAFFPVSADIFPYLWNQFTDGALLMANALRWVAVNSSQSPVTTYDVYLDTVDPPVDMFCCDLIEPIYHLSQLDICTTYYWQVVARNRCGVIQGPVWSFTTTTPAALTPSDPIPAQGAQDVLRSTQLSWRMAYHENFDDGMAQLFQEDVDSDWQVINHQYSADIPFPNEPTSMVATYGGGDFADFWYQADVRRQETYGNSRYLLFRATPDFEAYPLASGSAYLFGIDEEAYSVWKAIDGLITALQPWTSCPFLNVATQWNTLAVNASGPSLEFYINGNLVWSSSDAELAYGRIGLMGLTAPDDLFQQNRSHHYFDNIMAGEQTSATSGVLAPLQQWYNDHALLHDSLSDSPEITQFPAPPDRIDLAMYDTDKNQSLFSPRVPARVRNALDSIIKRSGILDGHLVKPAASMVDKDIGPKPFVYTAPEEIAFVRSAAVVGIETFSLLNIAVCGANSFDKLLDIQEKLLDTQQFNTVSIIDLHVVTPTLAELQSFDAVQVHSNSTYADPCSLGNVMADYVDNGGGVLCMMFETSVNAANPNRMMQGRWDNEEYFAICRSNHVFGSRAFLGRLYDPWHPVMLDVSTFDGGSASFRPDTYDVTADSVLVASWSDGRPLVVTKYIGTTPRVDMGFYPVSSDIDPSFWNTSTDGAMLMANALTWVATGGAQPQSTTYDLYFGTQNPPITLIAQDLSQTICDPTDQPGIILSPGITFYWQVIAQNNCHRSPGPIWHFTTSGLAGDANDDCRVDFFDFAHVAMYWSSVNCTNLNRRCNGADINWDGRVDLSEIAILAAHWLEWLPECD